MKIWDYFKEADESIRDDRIVSSEKYMKYGRNGIYRGKYPMLPHAIGIILGFSVARLFSLGFIFYLAFGLVFAFIIGTYKSCTYDEISLKYALAKNVLIMIPIAVLFMIIAIAFIVGV